MFLPVLLKEVKWTKVGPSKFFLFLVLVPRSSVIKYCLVSNNKKEFKNNLAKTTKEKNVI